MGTKFGIISEGSNATKTVDVNRFFIVMFTIAFIFVSSVIVISSQTTAQRARNDTPEIEYLNIDANIDNNYAITEITEMFKNPYNYSIDETFSFEIPAKAFISNFSLTIDNETYYAQIVSKDEGKQKYEEAKVNGSDAALVESKDKNVFSYSVSLSPYSEMIVGLRYEQFMEKSLGGYQYTIPLSSLDTARNINSFSIDVTITSKLSITHVELENYKEDAEMDPTAHKTVISYRTSKTVPTSDFIVLYELVAPPINGTLLNYNDGAEEYFFHVFSPQRTDLGDQVMAKEIIFVLDKSGSMSGEKISQLKTAFGEIIDQLRDNDMFNIVMFDSSIMEYKSELIEASEENRAEAVTYIDNIQAGGSTNINDALTTALDMFEVSETKVPIIVMLTDGLPTAGVTVPETIRENIKDKNTAGVAIFSLGFGYDLDFEFLKAMSLENYGIAIRIYEGQDASEQITDFYDTISTPLLKGLVFTYTKDAYEVYPTKVDQLFEGAEVVVVGKYEGTNNKVLAEITGNSWDGLRTFLESFELNKSSDNKFIPRFWAYAKIMYLLDLIAVSGENESYVENVTDLALEYGFVTPYTSLLVEIKEPEDDQKTDENKDTDGDGYTDVDEIATGTDPNDAGDQPTEAEPVPPPDDDDDNDNDPGYRPGIPIGIIDTTEDKDSEGVPASPPDTGGDGDSGEPNSYYPSDKPKKKGGEEKKEDAGLNAMSITMLPVLFIVIIILSVFGYSKIQRHRLLQQKRREMIFKHINENPGEHFRGIQKALELEVGVVAYHINKLEHEEFIKSRQDGQKRRFYPMNAKIDVKLILSQIQERIINWIKTNPGSSGSTIANNLGVNKKVVSYHIKILQSAGFIYTEKSGENHYVIRLLGYKVSNK